MKKALIALAAAAAISPAAFAGDVSWGGDANVEGYLNRTENNDGETTVDTRGYTNRIRLKGTFKTDGNVSVNTRLILQDSAWEGDAHSGVQGEYQDSANDAVALDYGYIQAPIAGWTFRFGRQVANWANCFLTCDDRRDRMLAMKRFGGTTVILLNDKRAGGTANVAATTVAGATTQTGSVTEVNTWVDANADGIVDAGEVTTTYTADTTTAVTTTDPGSTTNYDERYDKGEGDLYAAAAVGVVKGWQWGLLVGKWIGEQSYNLDEVYAISPFVKGKAGPVKLQAAINILGGGNEDGAAFFTDTATSAYIKAGMEVGSVMLEGQAIIVDGGGLVAGGFDSFSMLISNDADNNASNTRVAQIGGLGKQASGSAFAYLGENYFADDEYLLGFRASGKAGKIGWKVAATYYDVKNTNTDGFSEKDYSISVLDGGVTYSVAKTTELYLNAAIGAKSDDLDSSGDSDEDYQAATVGINTTF